jgi:hypothetical protein
MHALERDEGLPEGDPVLVDVHPAKLAELDPAKAWLRCLSSQ